MDCVVKPFLICVARLIILQECANATLNGSKQVVTHMTTGIWIATEFFGVKMNN
jgi:hypothetical protein